MTLELSGYEGASSFCNVLMVMRTESKITWLNLFGAPENAAASTPTKQCASGQLSPYNRRNIRYILVPRMALRFTVQAHKDVIPA